MSPGIEDVFPIEKLGYSSNRYVSLPKGFLPLLGWSKVLRFPRMVSQQLLGIGQRSQPWNFENQN